MVWGTAKIARQALAVGDAQSKLQAQQQRTHSTISTPSCLVWTPLQQGHHPLRSLEVHADFPCAQRADPVPPRSWQSRRRRTSLAPHSSSRKATPAQLPARVPKADDGRGGPLSWTKKQRHSRDSVRATTEPVRMACLGLSCKAGRIFPSHLGAPAPCSNPSSQMAEPAGLLLSVFLRIKMNVCWHPQRRLA